MYNRLTLILIALLMTTVASFAAGHRFTLVIDAGHGGHDSGAVGAISKEKNINLRTALAFGRYVEANCPDVNVIYTRKTDVFIPLHERANIANRAKADLFISIHTNSVSGSKSVKGFETYTLGMHRAGDNLDVAKRENSVILVEKDYKEHYEGFDPNSAESYIIFEFMQDHNMAKSVELAKYVQSNATSLAGRVNKGVKQAGFLVLRETSMPSCLIELGFISTPEEEQALNNSSVMDNIARGIYNAFVTYKNKYDVNKKQNYSHEAKNTADTEVRREDATASASSQSVAAAEEKPASDDRVERTAQKKEEPKKEVKKEESKKEEPKKSEPKKEEPKKEVKKEESKKEEPKKSEPKKEAPVKKADDAGRPVFKVQVFTSDNVLSSKSSRFKGHADAAYYKENGMVKYTIGSSANYNEIYRLRKELATDFPDCFIIAFKNGEKMNVNEAIREFKARR